MVSVAVSVCRMCVTAPKVYIYQELYSTHKPVHTVVRAWVCVCVEGEKLTLNGSQHT